jgi:hypothetical protein
LQTVIDVPASTYATEAPVMRPPQGPVHRYEDPDTIRFAPVIPPKPRATLASLDAVARVYLPLLGAIALAFCFDMALGGLAGVAWGTPRPGATGTTDLGMAIGAAAVVVTIGGFGAFWYARGGRWMVIEDGAPVLAKWTAPLRVAVVIVLLVVFVIGTCSALLVPQTTTSQPTTLTDLSLNLWMTLSMIQGAIACGYSLVRRIRRRGASDPLVISSPLPPAPPAHS